MSGVNRRFGVCGWRVPLAIALLGAFTSVSNATTIGPDSFGYVATDELPFTFTDISGTGTPTLTGTDDSVFFTPIGFNFNFYGTTYTDLFFSTNGLITFGGGNGDFNNTDLTTSADPAQPAIAPLWDDLETFSNAGAVYYQTLGAPGSRSLVIQWNDVRYYCCSGGTITFEAILFEGSNEIRFAYLNLVAGRNEDNGASATVGIRNAGGEANGQNLQWSFDQGVHDEQAITFFVRPVPEPSSLVLLLVAMLGLSAVMRYARPFNRRIGSIPDDAP